MIFPHPTPSSTPSTTPSTTPFTTPSTSLLNVPGTLGSLVYAGVTSTSLEERNDETFLTSNALEEIRRDRELKEEEERQKRQNKLRKNGYFIKRTGTLREVRCLKDCDIEENSIDTENIDRRVSKCLLAITTTPENTEFLVKVIATHIGSNELYVVTADEENGVLKATMEKVEPWEGRHVVFRKLESDTLVANVYLKETVPTKEGIRYVGYTGWNAFIEEDALVIPDNFGKVAEPEDLEILYHLYFGNLQGGCLMNGAIIKATLVVSILVLISIVPALLAAFTDKDAATIVYGGLGTAPLVLGLVALIMTIVTGDKDWIVDAYHGEFKTKNVKIIRAFTGLDLAGISRELAYIDIRGEQVAPTNTCTARFDTNGWIRVRSPVKAAEMKGMGYFKIPGHNCVYDYIGAELIEISGNSVVAHLEQEKEVKGEKNRIEPEAYGQSL